MSVIYVVSDLHGCYDKYIKLLERLKMTSDDSLYIIGDIMDRGSDGMKTFIGSHQKKKIYILSNSQEDIEKCKKAFFKWKDIIQQ